MTKKSSAYYQRQYRERLRSQGLVKKEVWILPTHAKTLSMIESHLREPIAESELPFTLGLELAESQEKNQTSSQGNRQSNKQTAKQLNKVTAGQVLQNKACWTTQSLYQALCAEQQLQRQLQKQGQGLNQMQLRLIDEVANTEIIHIVMQDFGDLPIFMTVQGEQIIVETILCTVDEVQDVADFNQMVLRTHKYFPLSTISLDTLVMSDGKAYDAYQMFGSLSSHSGVDKVVLEIQMLASNVMQALEAYSDYFIKQI